MSTPTRRAARVAIVAVVFLLGACAGTGDRAGATPVGAGFAGSPDARASASPASGASDYTDDVFALSADADRAYRQGRWIEAVRRYRLLAERVPTDAYAWFRLGNVHAHQGDYERASDAYRRSLERDATQAKPWFNLATAHLLNAQVALGEAWQRLREGDPARALIEARLQALATLVHGRIEDMPIRTGAR